MRDAKRYKVVVADGVVQFFSLLDDDITVAQLERSVSLTPTTRIVGNKAKASLHFQPKTGASMLLTLQSLVSLQDKLGRAVTGLDTYEDLYSLFRRLQALERLTEGVSDTDLVDPVPYVATGATLAELPLPSFGYSVLKVDLDTLGDDVTVQGLPVPASKEQRTIFVQNTSATHSLSFSTDDAGQATEGKRIRMSTTSGTLGPNATAVLYYDVTGERWTVSNGGSTANTGQPAPTYEFLDQWVHLQGLSVFVNDAERKVAWAKRFATNLVAGGADYIHPNFSIPSGKYQQGASFVDLETGLETTVVVAADRTIKNSERWIIGPNGLFFYAIGSGSTTRNLEVYKHGKRHFVLGQVPNEADNNNPHRLPISVNASNTTDANNRANNAWWVSDELIAFVSGDNEITTKHIYTGAETTLTVDFPANDPAYILNLDQSDAADARRAYPGPFSSGYITDYNAVNVTNPIDLDKVYRIFHVTADKLSYIVLVYTISTGTWSYLTGPGGSAVVSETATCTVHTISGIPGVDMDHLTLTTSGKGIYSNTNNSGFNYHYLTGEFVVNLYSASNHKGFGPTNGGADVVSEKGTPAATQNAAYGNASEGDMLFIEFTPETETVVGYPALKKPPSDPAPEYGGDQGAHTGVRVHILAGQRDVSPEIDRVWDHSIVILDHTYANMEAPDLYKWSAWRAAGLNVLGGGGDAKDPGAVPGIYFEHPDHPGKWVTEVYWFDDNIPLEDGGTGDAILHTILPIAYDIPQLKLAMADAGYERQQ